MHICMCVCMHNVAIFRSLARKRSASTRGSVLLCTAYMYVCVYARVYACVILLYFEVLHANHPQVLEAAVEYCALYVYIYIYMCICICMYYTIFLSIALCFLCFEILHASDPQLLEEAIYICSSTKTTYVHVCICGHTCHVKLRHGPGILHAHTQERTPNV
jgi:hypothetical protein